MREFTFEFEELPLVTVGETEACLINGEAVIEYDRAGLWDVIHIALDGFRDGKHLLVPAPTNIQALVMERLYGTWHDKVQDAVSWQLQGDREAAADDHADMIRERRLDL